ncbi:glycosyl transferase, group 1 [Psychromonas ingrahamii 37]|uniref:Glycosyl transferase, group 1 n=1 Tax=Psychromonas ingrahamii (strain DSM 17664 / CCUG 51855 / 37) TaxID=357804 RepID=A1SS34_PSYIN|nr:glycosyltransferase family 4 protein [Psychromonas ingrahamii]ABM02299.1 glycosyl transferase, group 1 [Psychromonas ingrahamii 37]
MYRVKIFLGRTVIFSLYFLIRLFSLLPKKKKKKSGNIIVLTGTFYSKNWIDAHLRPLVTCKSVKHVYIVCNELDYDLQGLSVVAPSKISTKLIGSTLARLIAFAVCVVKKNPDYIGGFHILFNGTLSILFANILRCRSIYFSVGGITETLVVGKTENNFFKFLNGKDDFLTAYICKIAANATQIITMGNGAKLFFVENGVNNHIVHVISGAINKNIFYPSVQAGDKKYDLVLTARLSKVKQVELLLKILAYLQQQNFLCNALIIGDGPLLESLKKQAEELTISEQVDFVGHQNDIVSWLHQAKIYILTSRSEGLSLSMLEGLKSGLPAIVPNVGDLSDVLIHGYNGALIENHSIDDFAHQITSLLSNPQKLDEYSQNAIASTHRFDLECVRRQWEAVFMVEDR